jgi:hypothetical protein
VRTESRDLFLRVFDDEPERSAPVPELGPFSVIDTGTYELRADGLMLAVRASSMAPWILTDNTGAQGVAKEVLTLRASSAHRSEAEAPRAFVRPVEAPPAPAVAVEPAPPSVWVDRVRPPREIYISRPDVPRKRS